MNKEEALAVMHEIYESCRESLTLTCVSLDSKQVERTEGGYQIRMKGDLDVTSRGILDAVLGKRGLCMREEQGYVIVY